MQVKGAMHAVRGARRHTCSMLCMVSRPLLARGRLAAAAAAAAAARASGPMSCSIACAHAQVLSTVRWTQVLLSWSS